MSLRTRKLNLLGAYQAGWARFHRGSSPPSGMAIRANGTETVSRLWGIRSAILICLSMWWKHPRMLFSPRARSIEDEMRSLPTWAAHWTFLKSQLHLLPKWDKLSTMWPDMLLVFFTDAHPLAENERIRFVISEISILSFIDATSRLLGPWGKFLLFEWKRQRKKKTAEDYPWVSSLSLAL